MTREHKLALILGFAVVLIVGVLFADHFSKARTTKTDDQMALRAPEMGSQPLPGPATPMSGGATMLVSHGGNGSALPTDNPLPPSVQPVSQEATRTAVDIPNGTPTGGAEEASSRVPSRRVGDNSPLSSGIAYQNGKPVGPAAAQTDTTPIGGGDHGVSKIEPGTSTNPGLPALPISKGTESRYPVEAGDTLYKIAKNVYGDSALWKKLGEYNKDKIRPDGTNLREGVTLRIPPKDVLLGIAALAPNAKSTELAKPAAGKATPPSTPVKPADEKPATKVATNAKPAPRTYTVKGGDTFSKIAAKELGTAKRWEEIASLNPSLDSSELKVGDTVKLPAK